MLFLSIRPQFAKAILCGNKTAEIRRIGPNARRGDYVLLYASSPVKAIVGMFCIEEILCYAVETLWEKVGDRAGIDEATFKSYLNGRREGVAIMISNCVELGTPIPLDEIKRIWPTFRPPESYRYLPPSNDHANDLLDSVGGLLRQALFEGQERLPAF